MLDKKRSCKPCLIDRDIYDYITKDDKDSFCFGCDIDNKRNMKRRLEKIKTYPAHKRKCIGCGCIREVNDFKICEECYNIMGCKNVNLEWNIDFPYGNITLEITQKHKIKQKKKLDKLFSL